MAEPPDTARWVLATAAHTRGLAGAMAPLLERGDVLVLSGELGAGKTTFVQGLAAAMGVRGDVTSPTFVIARVHPPRGSGPALVHVDAYRLTASAELDDLDLDAYTADAVTVVEWGTRLAAGLATDRIEVVLERPDAAAGTGDGDEARVLRLGGTGARWRAVAAGLGGVGTVGTAGASGAGPTPS